MENVIHGDAKPVVIYDPQLQALYLFVEVEGKLYGFPYNTDSLQLGTDRSAHRILTASVEMYVAEMRVAQSAIKHAP